MRTGTFRYVIFEQVDRFVAAGWIVGNVASAHSVLMWACACNQEGRKP